MLIFTVTHLHIEDLYVVQNTVWDARARWYNVGLGLHISAYKLDAIKETHKNSTDPCFTDMLAHWLKTSHPKPSLNALAKALESPSVEYGELAERISSKG